MKMKKEKKTVCTHTVPQLLSSVIIFLFFVFVYGRELGRDKTVILCSETFVYTVCTFTAQEKTLSIVISMITK